MIRLEIHRRCCSKAWHIASIRISKYMMMMMMKVWFWWWFVSMRWVLCILSRLATVKWADNGPTVCAYPLQDKCELSLCMCVCVCSLSRCPHSSVISAFDVERLPALDADPFNLFDTLSNKITTPYIHTHHTLLTQHL